MDAITLWLVNGLALLKTYGLLSFMFGVGRGFLVRSAARRGLLFGRIYRNRMIGRGILTEGGFFKTVLFRSIGFAFIMPSFLVIQGIAELGWFCLGLAAVKTGMIDDAGHPL